MKNNFSQNIQSVKEIFTTNYEIPFYQRPYSWDENPQLTDLLSDIEILVNGKEESMFLGVIVLTQDGKKKEVVDGQQRLTSLSLLFAAIRTIYKEIGNHNYSFDIERNFLKESYLEDTTYRLKLQEEYNEYYKKEIIDNGTIEIQEGKNDIEKKLKKAYEFLYSGIKKMVTIKENISEEELKRITTIISDNFYLVTITADNEINANIIFETLNDRGKDLTPFELLKNYLNGKNENEEKKLIIKNNWKKIESNLKSKDRKNFIFHYYWAFREFFRTKDLYKKVKEDVSKSQLSTVDFSNDLRAKSELYNTILSQVKDNYKSEKIFKSIETLTKTFGVTNSIPVIMIILDRISDKNEQEKILDLLEKFIFKYQVIGKANTGSSQAVFIKLCDNLRGKNYAQMYKALLECAEREATDYEFKENFLSNTLSDTKKRKYVLDKINTHLSGDEITTLHSNTIQVEHIWPSNPKEGERPLDDQREYDFYKEKLGNLTLLHGKKNNNLSNKVYENKIDTYRESKILITNTIPNKYPKWDKESIDSRQNEFYELAKEIWKY